MAKTYWIINPMLNLKKYILNYTWKRDLNKQRIASPFHNIRILEREKKKKKSEKKVILHRYFNTSHLYKYASKILTYLSLFLF